MAYAIMNVTEIGGDIMYPSTVDEDALLDYLTNSSGFSITDRNNSYVEFTRSDSFVIRVYSS